ncbi:transposase [candidate division KSB1 bacterium]
MEKELKKRKLNRLKGYDYSMPGLYYITFCTFKNIEWFGKVIDGQMNLNDYGDVAKSFWMEIPKIHRNLKLDEVIIMPNHIHGILIINDETVGTEHCSVQKETSINYSLLSKIVKSYKEKVSKTLKRKFKLYDFKWQRSFYDHIIRNEKSLNEIRKYIVNNPAKWEDDRNNPENLD